jgi:hypothetical protein
MLSLDELRRRMPELRPCEQPSCSQSSSRQTGRAVHLRLAETLSCFLDWLRTAANTFDIEECQRIVRLGGGNPPLVLRLCAKHSYSPHMCGNRPSVPSQIFLRAMKVKPSLVRRFESVE